MGDKTARTAWAAPLVLGFALGGCQLFVDDADREVYRLVEKRQIQAVGVAHDMQIDSERVPITLSDTARDFVPHPVTSETPESFRRAVVATQPARPGISTRPEWPPEDEPLEQAEPDRHGVEPSPSEGPEDSELPEPAEIAREESDTVSPLLEILKDAKIMSLSEALAYAFQNARDFQNAKEDLYLAALDLTLERHLWTPQLVGDISSELVQFPRGEDLDFDRAMETVSRVAVEQRLPYGGRLTAQVLGSLVRDLTDHVTTGETGQALLTAEIPLLRGAGPVAYESRYLAERRLIYAIRTFERFRRSLAVSVAADYFDLQQLRQQIVNAEESIEGFDQLARRARAFWKTGRVTIVEAQRAEQDQLRAINTLVDAVEQYRNALDLFKIRIGMPTGEKISVPLPDVAATQPADAARDIDVAASTRLTDELAMPDVDEAEAVRVALKYRLDLLNELDRIGDAERGVRVAENAILPALDLFGSVQLDTDREHLNMIRYHADRTTWRGGMTLELPLDRKAERNRLRASLIDKRRAERNYELARDIVVQQVRRAMRRVEQQQQVVEIQVINRDLALRRLRAAQLRFQKALIQAFEVVDAQTELLEAQNRLAAAQAALKVAILEFWRDTDVLRIDDDGRWELELATAMASE